MQVRERFLTMVEVVAGLDRLSAERVARATLESLYDRIAGGQARDLAERLGGAFVRPVSILPDKPAQHFDAQELVRRVAEQAGVDAPTAERYATAVLTAVRLVAGEDEFRDAATQLDASYEDLLEEAARPHVEVRSGEAFVHEVAELADVGLERAGLATQAVLATLGERIPDLAVDDLAPTLPEALADALARGKVHRPGAPRKLDVDDFVDRVAEREETVLEEGRRDARAVFAALSRAVPDRQFHDDVVLQLPDDFARLVTAGRT